MFTKYEAIVSYPRLTATDLLCPNMPYITTKGRGVRVSLPLYIKTCTKLCKMLQNKTEVLHQFILQALVTHTDSLPGTRLLGIDCFGSNDDAKSLKGRYVSLFFSSGQCPDSLGRFSCMSHGLCLGIRHQSNADVPDELVLLIEKNIKTLLERRQRTVCFLSHKIVQMYRIIQIVK